MTTNKDHDAHRRGVKGDRVYLLLRVAAILAVTSVVILMINGPYDLTSEDDEMPLVILAVIWATLYLTKRRRT